MRKIGENGIKIRTCCNCKWAMEYSGTHFCTLMYDIDDALIELGSLVPCDQYDSLE